MKLNRFLSVFIFPMLFAFLILTSCKKKEEDPQANNEAELITTIRMKFTEGGNTRTFTFRDLDGAGGNPPVVDNIALANGRSYTLDVEVLNESNPAKVEDKTSEILAEGAEHQFFFTGTATTNLLTVTYSDRDKDSRPIGLKNSVTARSTGTGQLTVSLRHKPNKGAVGVANGQITNAGGETDIEVSFNVVVQ